MALELTTAGKKLRFRPNGDLAVADGGQETVRGTWRAKAAAGEAAANQFTYTLDGVSRQARALYTFTETNQLRVVLRDGGGASAPADLVGGIEVDDQHDIIYRLTDEDGDATGQVIVLYGELRIERNTNALVVALEGGGEARVTGDQGIRSLEAAQNRIAKFAADDLLRFRATTSNVLDDGTLLPIPARLEFAGSWDIVDGQLTFLSKVAGNLARPDVAIGFAGRLGAVTAGFVYFAGPGGNSAAFTIRGQHVWRAGDTQSEANWQVSLGFSDKKFAAAVEFDASRTTQNGRRLTFNGTMALKQADGGVLDLDFTLKAEYAWQDNALVFKALVNNQAGNFNYDLMLEGRLRAQSGNLTFSIRFSNRPTVEGLTIALNFQGDRDNAIQALSFHLRLSPGAIDLRIQGTFMVRQRFVAGVGRVLEEEVGAVA